MMTPELTTVKDIVVAYLKANGYDGLWRDWCGCLLEDLAPCDDTFEDCKPGYRTPCDDRYCDYAEDHHWHIEPERKEETDANP